MIKLRDYTECLGLKIRDPNISHECVKLTGAMLKPLWLQAKMGVEQPCINLKGVVSTFTKRLEYPSVGITANSDFRSQNIYVRVRRVYDIPGVEYQIYLAEGNYAKASPQQG